VIVGIIRRKPVITHASIVCEGMLASVNSVNFGDVSQANLLEKQNLKLFILKCYSGIGTDLDFSINTNYRSNQYWL